MMPTTSPSWLKTQVGWLLLYPQASAGSNNNDQKHLLLFQKLETCHVFCSVLLSLSVSSLCLLPVKIKLCIISMLVCVWVPLCVCSRAHACVCVCVCVNICKAQISYTKMELAALYRNQTETPY